LPWARTPATSFVEPPETYRRLLAAAGFDIVSERERTGEIIEILRRERERIEREGMPALNRHILSGPDWAARSANIRKALDAGLVAPVEIIARAA
jgi:hypothetical protein